MNFGPGSWTWNNGSQISLYTTTLGRLLLTCLKERYFLNGQVSLIQISNPIGRTCGSRHVLKRKRFVWHNVVAVHSWQARIKLGLDTSCNCYSTVAKKIPIHRFYHCLQARHVWDYFQSSMHHLLGDQPNMETFTWFDHLLWIFGSMLPRTFHEFRTIWSFLRGPSLWLI